MINFSYLLTPIVELKLLALFQIAFVLLVDDTKKFLSLVYTSFNILWINNLWTI